MVVAAATISALVAGAVFGTLFYYLGRRSIATRSAGLEARLAQMEATAARRYLDRLGPLRRRLGILHLDGLATTQERELSELFESGVGFAAQANWDRARGRWDEARKHAGPHETVALTLLAGTCQLLCGRKDEAVREFESALARAQAAGDAAGSGAAAFARAVVAAGSGSSADAERGFEQAAAAAERLGLVELEAAALAGRAELPGLAVERLLDLRRQAIKALERAGDRSGASRQYGAIGDCYLQAGDTAKALAAHESGLRLARLAKDRVAEAGRLVSIAVIRRQEKDDRRALAVLEDAHRIYEEVKQPQGQARAFFELGLLHERLGERDAALEYFERVLSLARGTSDSELMARSLSRIAAGCVEHGAGERAVLLLKEAVGLDAEAGRERDLGADQAGLGRALLALGDSAGALTALGKALETSRRLGDARAESAQLLDLARAQRLAGQTGAAAASLEQGRAIAGRLGDQALLAEVQAESARADAAGKDWPKAIAAFEAALGLHRKLGSRFAQAQDLIELGGVLEQAGRLDDARRHLEDALRMAHTAGDQIVQARTLAAIGSVNRARGDLNLARENYVRALRLCEEMHEARLQAGYLVELAQVVFEMGDAAGALARLQQALRLFVRLNDRRGMDRVNAALARLPRAEQGVQVLDEPAV